VFINRLKATNASNYDNLDHTFRKGITLINGDNLSGKSSILDILRFALYGHCRKSKKIEYFKKRGSTGPLETEVWFDYKNQEWHIRRYYATRENTAEIEIDGKPVATGIDNVKKYLADNFVSEAFLANSNLCQQGDSSNILEAKDTDRFNLCKKIFDLKFLKPMVAKATEDQKGVADELVAVKGKVEVITEYAKSTEEWLAERDKESLQHNISELTESVKLQQDKRQSLVEQRAKAQAELDSIDAFNNNVRQGNRTYTATQERITSLETSVESNRVSLLSKQTNVSTTQTEINELSESIERLEAEYQKYIPVRVPHFDRELLDSLQSDQAEYSNDITNIEREIQSKEKGICFNCGKPLDDTDISGLNKDLVEVKSKLASGLEKITELKRRGGEIADIEKEAQEIREKRIKLDGDIAQAKSSLEAKGGLVVSFNEDIKGLDNSMESVSQELERLQKEFETMEVKQVKSTSDLEANVKLMDDRLLVIDTNLKETEGKKTALEDDFNFYASKEEQFKQYQGQLQGFETDIERLSKEEAVLTKVRNILEKQLPLFIVLNKLKYISDQSNGFLHKTFDKYDLSFEQAKDALSINYKDTVTNLPSDATNLSGYEGSLCGLAIRMGFSFYNTTYNQDPVSWIALDEVDESFRNDRAEVLYKTIFDLRQMFQQIIMVTHKEQIKDILNPEDIIEVKNNGVNSYLE